MSLENKPIDYGGKGFSWTNVSMRINVPKDKPHPPKIAYVALATGLVFGGYQLANPEKASALQDPTPYPLKCEPIVENGLGAIDGIPAELQGRATCFDVNGQQESVIFYCDQVLNSDPALAVLDGNSTNQSALCYEGPSDLNGNGVSDYNPIKLNVGAINGLTAPIEAVQKSPAPPSPTPTPEPSVGEAVAAVGGIVLLLLFGGFLNAKRSYASGHLDGEKKGISIGGEIEEAVKSNPAVKKLSNKVRKAERKKRGIK